MALYAELADIFNENDNQCLWRELLNRVSVIDYLLFILIDFAHIIKIQVPVLCLQAQFMQIILLKNNFKYYTCLSAIKEAELDKDDYTQGP